MQTIQKEEGRISEKKAWILFLVGIGVLLFVDRLTKILAVQYLKDTDGVTLIYGGLRLYYLENHGAAFGILQNKQVIFWILTAVFIVVVLWFFRKVPKTKYYRPINVCVMVLLAGALGNFIDRIFQQYVVDFIYFEFIDFPIFNVADIYVTLSVIILLLLVLFKYKEGDFSFLRRKKKTEKAEPLEHADSEAAGKTESSEDAEDCKPEEEVTTEETEKQESQL